MEGNIGLCRIQKCYRLPRLSGLNATVHDSVLPFFYGGIQSCIDRKLDEQVPADAWDLIVQFSGLRLSFPKNLDEILGPTVEEKCRTLYAEEREITDVQSMQTRQIL